MSFPLLHRRRYPSGLQNQLTPAYLHQLSVWTQLHCTSTLQGRPLEHALLRHEGLSDGHGDELWSCGRLDLLHVHLALQALGQVTCHMSHVTICHIPQVTCHMSPGQVTCRH